MISFLRKKFNSARQGDGIRRVYLDNAGATEIGERAKRALLESLDIFGNPSGIHKEGAQAGVLLDKARALCATALNAHAYEVYFLSSGTESCNLAVMGVYEEFRRLTVRQSDSQTIPHVVTTEIEHPSVLEPIKFLERTGKIRVTYLPVYEDGVVKVHDLREALCEETILVSVMYANNEIGTIQPVKEIGRAIDEWKREHNKTFTSYPYFHTDACQAANYCDLDVLRLKCHLMTVNSSKVYGPKGSALLYRREGIKLSPVSLGGGQERGLRSGTEAVAFHYAFGVALAEACEIREEESARLRALRDEAVELLKKEIPSVIFYGAFDKVRQSDSQTVRGQTNTYGEMRRLPNNINCRVPGISSEEMILRLDAKGFAISHKSACASMETEGSYVVMALGATEVEANENIRISLGRSTSRPDLDRLVEAMKDISTKYIK
jgi:cysteine desulfurase